MIEKYKKNIINKTRENYKKLDNVFTAKEALALFKIATLLETIGWTLLITGIVFDKLRLPGYEFILPIGGSIHGILFLFYVFMVLFGHRSLKWSVPTFLIAEFVSVVPYGALAFELIITRKNREVLAKV